MPSEPLEPDGQSDLADVVAPDSTPDPIAIVDGQSGDVAAAPGYDKSLDVVPAGVATADVATEGVVIEVGDEGFSLPVEEATEGWSANILKVRAWNAGRVAAGGIGAGTVVRTVGVVAVAAALANAYILPPDERSGAQIPVAVEAFSQSITDLGVVGVLGNEPKVVPGGEGEPAAGTWTITPMDGWQAGLGSLVALDGGGQVPRTVIASTGVRLSAVEARFVIPAVWSGIAFRASGPNSFWAAVADPNPRFIRIVKVDDQKVQTAGRFEVSGGLFSANVRIELGADIVVKVNGRVVGRVVDDYLAQFRANAGFAVLDAGAVGATFDDLVLWADQTDIADARSKGLDDNSAFGKFPGGSGDMSALVEAFRALTPEQRKQLENLTPEQVEQLKQWSK